MLTTKSVRWVGLVGALTLVMLVSIAGAPTLAGAQTQLGGDCAEQDRLYITPVRSVPVDLRVTVTAQPNPVPTGDFIILTLQITQAGYYFRSYQCPGNWQIFHAVDGPTAEAVYANMVMTSTNTPLATVFSGSYYFSETALTPVACSADSDLSPCTLGSWGGDHSGLIRPGWLISTSFVECPIVQCPYGRLGSPGAGRIEAGKTATVVVAARANSTGAAPADFFRGSRVVWVETWVIYDTKNPCIWKDGALYCGDFFVTTPVTIELPLPIPFHGIKNPIN